MRPIDADALKTHVCDMCDDGQRECKGDESCAILCWINDMPTIEPEVRHGRWVYDETIGGMKHYYCTSCKEQNPSNECCADENQILWFDFCPKCGAKMDGGADNDA